MPRNAVRALLEEWDRSRRELVDLLPRLRDEELQGGDPLDETRARGILIHVLRSGYSYAGWICEVLGFPKPERSGDPSTGYDASTAPSKPAVVSNAGPPNTKMSASFGIPAITGCEGSVVTRITEPPAKYCRRVTPASTFLTGSLS